MINFVVYVHYKNHSKLNKNKMVFKNIFFKTLLTTTLSVFFCISSIAQTNWTSPFNGKNLKGWEIKQGSANFEVINNTIVATTLLGSKSTYLATKKNMEISFLRQRCMLLQD